MKKVLWIPPGPQNIYEPLYNRTIERFNDTEFILGCAVCKTKCREPKKFRAEYFPFVEYKFLFLPNMIYNKLKGLSSHDTTSMMHMKGLYRFLKKEKPDLVISNLEYAAYTWQSALYCYRNNVPFILQTETQRIDQKLQKLMFKVLMAFFWRKIFKKTNFVTAWTTDGLAFAKKNFPIKDKSKIMLLPLGVDTGLFYPEKQKAKSKILRLLVVSRFVPYKRYIDLLNAMKYLKDNSTLDFTLSIIGSGPMENEIKHRIEELNLANNVVFLDRMPYEKLRHVYSAHDVLLLPSYNEAIGMVVPEAMACGIPCIVSDTCGAKTYVKNGTNGYIFRTYDYVDLAKKILLLKDKNRIKEFGKKARKSIEMEFSLDVISEKMEQLIKNALK